MFAQGKTNKKISREEAAKNLRDLIFVYFLVFVSIVPYVAASFSLSAINPRLGFEVSGFLISFLVFPVGTMFFFFWRRKIQRPDPLKKFISEHAQKIFFIGVAIFIIIVVVSIIWNSNNLFLSAFSVVPSMIFILFDFLIMQVALKAVRRIKQDEKALSSE